MHQVRLHIVEFRGFERFIQGRPYWEVPVMVQRLCGICPVSHHLAASKALDVVVGAPRLTPTAEKVRRLMHYGQILQSHALHFFHLVSPDLLFGFDSDVAKRRNLVGVLAAYPELARQGVMLRKFGQEVIRITAGKRVHGTGSIPGGVNKSVSLAERDELLAPMKDVLEWAQAGVRLIKELHGKNRELYEHFGTVRSNLMSLVGHDGKLESLRRRAARTRRGRGHRLRRRGTRELPDPARGERALVELPQVPVHRRAGSRSGLVQGGPAGAHPELRLHRHPAGRSRASGAPRHLARRSSSTRRSRPTGRG